MTASTFKIIISEISTTKRRRALHAPCWVGERV
jgi:hypothetical protein